MPTYQYACTTCDHRFEAVQAFSDAALTQCPECQGSLRKVYSSVGVVFKGSGFYRNDSRSGSGSSGAAGGSGGSEAPAKDGAATKESSTSASSSKESAGAPAKESASAPKPAPASTSSSTAGSAV